MFEQVSGRQKGFMRRHVIVRKVSLKSKIGKMVQGRLFFWENAVLRLTTGRERQIKMRKLRCGKLRGRLKEEVTERGFLL